MKVIGFFVFNGIVPRALKPGKTKKTYRRQPVSDYLEHRTLNMITEHIKVILARIPLA
ncbi:hypothetical protein [Arenibacter algicola]|uniref:hypothetical protein n=1 Tax=Arenibacter algicola TaxID=616991 RepID=UPI001C07B9A0|nr:hypothetical protein [Arenibacter algicola]